MADPNLKDFYGRVYRIQKINRRGGGFEAAGTLGRAYFQPPPSRVKPGRIARPVLMLAIVITALKAMILTQLGAGVYAQHLATLMAGDTIDRLGGLLMTVDPVTQALASALHAIPR